MDEGVPTTRLVCLRWVKSKRRNARDASLNLAVKTAPPTDGAVEVVPSKDGPKADVSAPRNYMFVTSTANPHS